LEHELTEICDDFRMSTHDDDALEKQLSSIEKSIDAFFREATALWTPNSSQVYYDHSGLRAFSANLPEPLALERARLQTEIASLSAQIANLAQSSPLVSPADLPDLRINTRKMISSLNFEEYRYHEARLMGYEDQLYGVLPASQDDEPVKPLGASELCRKAVENVRKLLLFVTQGGSRGISPAQSVPPVKGGQFRPDTAFILMWMSDDHPELEDVKVGITEVFEEFGIRAIRADDIEHEEIITERITEEIATSEFLIADLTGARPNVYYEVGYAHALGKRVLLYRKKDEVLHFDLAGRNVPPYSNVADLKIQLRKRLAATLGTKARSHPIRKKKKK
jgi:hypothetical protein